MTTNVDINMHTAPADAGDGSILPNLLMFGETLRRLGIEVGTANMLDLVRATEYVPIGGNRNDFRLAARSLLVRRRADLELFDEAFQVFWRGPSHGRSMRDLRSMGEERRFRTPRVLPHRENASDGPPGDLDSEEANDRQPVVDLQRSFSAREVLRQRDFAEFTPSEIAAARSLMAELTWDLGFRRTRRLSPGDGSQLDLRRSMRNSLAHGGEMMDLAYRKRNAKPRPLVLICDVSGSMERYTRMLLHFVHTIAISGQQLEAFLFATRLTRITRQLSARGVDQAVAQVARAVPDWAGGTRIGESIKSFNYRWARRVLRGGAVVLIVSDGWDRGEPDLLAREMARLRRSCHRLIWLNPLLGSPTYQPLTRGMQAALPHVDDFLPAHNLHSLQELAQRLNSLSHRRRLPSSRPLGDPPADQPLPNDSEPRNAPNAARSRRELNPALAPTFRHPLWGHPNIPGGD